MNKDEIHKGTYRNIPFDIYFDSTDKMWYVDVHFPAVNGELEYTETSVAKEEGNAVYMAILKIDYYFWEAEMRLKKERLILMTKGEIRNRFESDFEHEKPKIEVLKKSNLEDGICKYKISGEFENGDWFFGEFDLNLLMKKETDDERNKRLLEESAEAIRNKAPRADYGYYEEIEENLRQKRKIDEAIKTYESGMSIDDIWNKYEISAEDMLERYKHRSIVRKTLAGSIDNEK